MTRRVFLVVGGVLVISALLGTWRLSAPPRPPSPPPEPEPEPEPDPRIPTEPPVNEMIRRSALNDLAPDGDRGITKTVSKLSQLSQVENGEVVAIPLGTVFNISDPDTFPQGLRGTHFTISGNRSLPLPRFAFEEGRGEIVIDGFESCSWEFLETAGGSGNHWDVKHSGDLIWRYCYAHNGGDIKGLTPGSGNVGSGWMIRQASNNVLIEYCECHDFAEDGIHFLGDNDPGAMHTVRYCYFHDNIEDGIDIKSGRVTAEYCWFVNNRSKNIVYHGNANQLTARFCRIAGTTLHDSVYIHGQPFGHIASKAGPPIVVESSIVGGANLYGFEIKDTARDVIVRNVAFSPPNGSGKFHERAHTGQLIVQQKLASTSESAAFFGRQSREADPRLVSTKLVL